MLQSRVSRSLTFARLGSATPLPTAIAPAPPGAPSLAVSAGYAAVLAFRCRCSALTSGSPQVPDRKLLILLLVCLVTVFDLYLTVRNTALTTTQGSGTHSGK